MESVTLTKINVSQNRLVVDFSVSEKLEKYFCASHQFWAEYTEDISSVPESILVVPILLNLLQFSWLTDSVIWVNEIDDDFYRCIPNLKNAFREMYPHDSIKGTLIAAKRIKNHITKKNEALQLFTGGIDATATMIRIKDKSPVLFNTNGWYKKGWTEENQVYNSDVIMIDAIAKENNLSSYYVKSNFATFILSNEINRDYCQKLGNTWWFGFQHSLAFIGTAIVLAYKLGIETIYLGSSYTFGQYICCVSDPRIDNSIDCAGINTIHDGYELSRQDKTKLIVSYQIKNKIALNLRVCSFNTHNCCECEKCFRSMLALIAEGVDDLSQYGFELDRPLLEKLQYFITYQSFDLDKDHIVFWNDIIDRMEQNYQNLAHKEIYDYLKTIDLDRARKQAVMNHYRKDYKEIIRRKLGLNKR